MVNPNSPFAAQRFAESRISVERWKEGNLKALPTPEVVLTCSGTRPFVAGQEDGTELR